MTELREHVLALLAAEKILSKWAEAVSANIREGRFPEDELQWLADTLVDINGPLEDDE